MFKINRNQFTEFSNNRKLAIAGLNIFNAELKKKKFKKGKLTIIPHNQNEEEFLNYSWNVVKSHNKIIFTPLSFEFKNKFLNFDHAVLSLIRRYGFLTIIFEMGTNQFNKNKEIQEIWGYRLLLFENIVIYIDFKCDEFYENLLKIGFAPEYHHVYCGTDDKIFGWDKF